MSAIGVVAWQSRASRTVRKGYIAAKHVHSCAETLHNSCSMVLKPDHVTAITCNPDDGCFRLESDKPKATVLSSVHPVSWHVDIHHIPAQPTFVCENISYMLMYYNGWACMQRRVVHRHHAVHGRTAQKPEPRTRHVCCIINNLKRVPGNRRSATVIGNAEDHKPHPELTESQSVGQTYPNLEK